MKLNHYNDNYAKVIFQDINGYQLQAENGKIYYSQWRNKGKKTMKVEIPSKYVKAGVNVQEGDVCIIKSEGELLASQLDATKKEWHFDVELPSGETKNAKFNKTSLTNLIEGFGTSESSEWVDKKIVASEIVKYAKGAGITWKVEK